MLVLIWSTPSDGGHQVSAVFIAFRVAQVIVMVELLNKAVVFAFLFGLLCPFDMKI
jgi:hypothetical protein